MGRKVRVRSGLPHAELRTFTSSADLNGFNDYDWTQDKTLQYKLAFANRGQSVEFGYYGALFLALAEGGFDQYYTNGFYAQRDPTNGIRVSSGPIK